MDQAQAGTKVKIEYLGRLEDGTVFDTNRMGELLEFTIGDGEMLQGLENAVVGMSAGEQRVVTLAPQDGYGVRDESLVTRMPRAKFPPDAQLEPGTSLNLHSKGQEIEVTVVAADNDSVTIDGNHPLAGKTLVFELELVEIVG